MAKEIEADIIVIVMALHNRTWLKYRILESIAENASLNSSVPVLIIPTNKKHFKMNTSKQLKEDIHFDEIKIDVELGDIMTDHEQEVFVRKYFAAKG